MIKISSAYKIIIVENVVTCFFGTRCRLRNYLAHPLQVQVEAEPVIQVYSQFAPVTNSPHLNIGQKEL